MTTFAARSLKYPAGSYPPRVLLVVGVLYALSGPLLAVWQRLRPPAGGAE